VIVDCSKHLNRILDLDVTGRRRATRRRPQPPLTAWAVVPVDVDASRATVGGLTATPAADARQPATPARTSPSIDAMLANGSKAHFGPVAADLSDLPANSPIRPLARDLFALGAREADNRGACQVQRRVGASSLRGARTQRGQSRAFGRIEGTLAFSTRSRSSCRRCSASARSAPAISAAFTGDGGGAASSSWRRSLWNWSTRP
jgi:hypothetical protein